MTCPDMDIQFVKGIQCLLLDSDESFLQISKMLEDSIMAKYGHVKFLEGLPSRRIKVDTISTDSLGHSAQNTRQSQDGHSSDNELALNLLKDDLTCVHCLRMDVMAGNQLMECYSCHSLYHQECHNPVITDSEMSDTKNRWMCTNCKFRIKKAKYSNQFLSNVPASRSSSYISSHSKSSVSSTSVNKPFTVSSSSSTSAIKSPPSNSSPLIKSSSSTHIKTSTSNSNSSIPKSSSFSKNTFGQSSNQHRSVAPNINIVSADKRLQIMKRKAAAKINEKRKKT